MINTPQISNHLIGFHGNNPKPFKRLNTSIPPPVIGMNQKNTPNTQNMLTIMLAQI